MTISKTAQARLRGYVFFVVNGKRFWRYDDARTERVRITDSGEPVEFVGWHIFLGWRWFYVTIFPRKVAVMASCRSAKPQPYFNHTPNITASAET